ncbi:hypothetical protein [Streptomyces sp. NPDC086787]
MVVMALLVPVMVMLALFALVAYEDLLFPPPTASQSDQDAPDAPEEPEL